MSTLFVDNLKPNLGTVVHSPGHIIQVVQNDSTTQFSQGGTTFTDTNLTCAITPKYSNSKVLVMVKQYFTFRTTTTAERVALTRLMRGSTEIAQQANNIIAGMSTDHRRGTFATFDVLDSPSTTNETTYKTQGRLTDSSADLYYQHDNSISTMLLMEIAQ
tara:strand:- start:84 stop:563 length:480 start_codon:yes stop_codon:yes gene_type:complete